MGSLVDRGLSASKMMPCEEIGKSGQRLQAQHVAYFMLSPGTPGGVRTALGSMRPISSSTPQALTQAQARLRALAFAGAARFALRYGLTAPAL